MVLSDKITLSEYRRIYENRKNSILTPHTLNHTIDNGSSIILLIIFEEFYSRVKYFKSTKLLKRIKSTIICFALTSDKKMWKLASKFSGIQRYRTVKLIGHFACERFILLFDVIGQFSGHFIFTKRLDVRLIGHFRPENFPISMTSKSRINLSHKQSVL